MEAVRTNVIGSENVIDSAIDHGVKRVILLSTDKAVYPINAMGISKALAEKVMVAKSRNLKGKETVLCCTRYGNVMASRGSVIPLFVDQIKAGKSLTITDPNMTRFMMTLDDALDLVLFAFEHGNNGDTFVQKAPSSTVGVLAKALLELYRANNEINIIGTRHGEKLYETLVNREEMVKAVDMKNYYRIPADTRDLNYNLFFTEGQDQIAQVEDYTSHNTEILNIEKTKTLLLKLHSIRMDVLNENRELVYEP
jgi:UDP-N-acetylglucosamine 4,6-dehydratase/5-epimerase